MAYLVMHLMSGKADKCHASNPGLTEWSVPQLNKGVTVGVRLCLCLVSVFGLVIDEEKAMEDHEGIYDSFTN